MKRRSGGISRMIRQVARREVLDRIFAWGVKIGLLGLVGLLVWGSLEIRSRVQAEPRFNLLDWHISLGKLPDWAPWELQMELEELRIGGTPEEPLTIFSPQVLAKVRHQILECSWIRSVRWIRLRAPGIGSRSEISGSVSADAPVPASYRIDRRSHGSIDLELELRIPIAAVAAGGAYYLTDRNAVRMGPAIHAERVRELVLPVIRGGNVAMPPPPGNSWEDRNIREGLEVARVLFDAGIAEEFPSAPIERIDISNLTRRSQHGECEILLYTPGLCLGWGRSPISLGARTLAVQDILMNLRRILKHPDWYSRFNMILLYTNPLVGIPSTLGP